MNKFKLISYLAIIFSLFFGRYSLAKADPSSFVSDDFDRANLDTPFHWEFVNPLDDGWVTMEGADSGDAQITLSVPEGGSHDPWTENRSVRVMQTATDSDFEIEAKFESEPVSGYQMQGIIVEQDDNNWLRFDLYHTGTELRVFAAVTIGGVSSSRVSIGVDSGDALYLRVNRSGDLWILQYAADGINWNTAGSFSQPLSVHAVGPFVANHSSGPISPAYTAIIDYFFNTDAPIEPEDGGAPEDTQAPFIHTNFKSQFADSVTITWHTDEPALGTVEYGTTTAYGSSVSDIGGIYIHSITLTSLDEGTAYHYRILSEDALGHVSSTTDMTFHFEERPVIDIWYGTNQTFGQIGQPQPWVNIFGNVLDSDGISNLSYSLNAGPEIYLSMGPDSRRLLNPGDFNIDLATADLFAGNNTVVITATDSLNNPRTQAVNVSYQTGNVWPIPYTINWSSLTSDGNAATPDPAIQTVAQVVDGKWSINNSVVRTVEPGYDRLIGIGDMTWDDYEAIVPIIIHDTLASNSGVGFLFGWNGHTDEPVTCIQPKCGWIPYGAIGWITRSGVSFYNTGVASPISVPNNIPYWMKMRVQTGPESATYNLKVWQDGTPEPTDWDISYTDTDDPVINGSMMLISHMTDVSFGNVIVYPLSGEPNLPPIANSDSAYVVQGGDVDIDILLNDIDPDGYLDPATVTIHDPAVSGSITVYTTTGTVNYSHDDTPPETDAFSYTVDDNEGDTSNEISVTVNVKPTGAYTFQSDDFNGCALDPVWTFINPFFDSSYELVNPFTADAQLAITVPAGTEHQLWTDGPTVARVMQPAVNEDFDLEVKFDSLLTEEYQEQGIVVEGTDGDFLRLEYFSESEGVIHLFVALIENYNEVPVRWDYTLESGLPHYLRVTRVGDLWTQYRSYNGIDWTPHPNFVSYSHPITVTHVGVYAGNAVGATSPAHTALVDYFQNNDLPIVAEDSELNSLSWSTVGMGSVDVDPISSNYACNTPVTVTAQANENWLFNSWSGDLSGGVNPENLVMDGAHVITATFVESSQIIVVKQTDPDGDSQVFNFTPSYTGTFQLADDQSNNSGPLDPGSYSVSESPTAGWDLTSATCDNGDTPDDITLGAGDTVTCTFTNTKEGEIIVVKQTDPDGDSQVFDFTPSYAGPFQLSDGQSNNSGLLDPGSYSVSESPTAGWSLTSATCDNGDTPDDITLEAGDTVTCTFTNTKEGEIIVVKQTDPDGDSQVFDFTPSYAGPFQLADDQSNNSGSLDPGSYSVSESPTAGWDLTSATCDNGDTPDDITLGAGDTVTCTFTNTKEGEIIVVKQTDPDGDSQVFDFTPSYAGPFQLSDGQSNNSGLLDPGSYSVSESPTAGWSLTSATCDNGDTPDEITLEAGETVTCTFTNNKEGGIIVVKQTDPDGDSQVFNFTPSYTGTFQLADDQSNNSGPLDPGSYSVSESPTAGWSLTSATCDNGDTPDDITLGIGDTVTCTFTNTKEGEIIVVKQTDPDGDSQVFNFTPSYAGPFQLADGQSNNSGSLDPGSYSVSESLIAGWDLTSATCDNGDTPDDITLGIGDTVTCTFTNTKEGEIIVVKQTDPDGDSQVFNFTPSYTGTFQLADGQSYNTGTLNPGSYSVSESLIAGWDLTSATCDNGDTPDDITLEAGDTVTCTFTNTKEGEIIVVKQTDPDGDSQVFNFTPSYTGTFQLADGQSNNSGLLNPGSYSVSESPTAGWDLTSATCDNGDTPDDITLEAGDTVTCTFTNSKQGEIIVVKQTDPDGESQVFGFTPSYAGPFQLADGQSNNSGLLDPGSYSVSESPTAGWSLTSATCDNGNTPDDITLEAGETVTCTFTNTKEGEIIVVKQTDPDGDSQVFDFTPSYAGPFQLADGQSNNSGLLDPGSYSVSESPTARWSLTSATCDNGDTPDDITLEAGETVTCTFTNSYIYELYLPIIIKQEPTETVQVEPIPLVATTGSFRDVITLLLSMMGIFFR